MGGVLRELCARFGKLYKRRAHLHHFTQYMEADGLAAARETVKATADEYAALHLQPTPSEEAIALMQRLRGAPTGGTG